MSYMPTNVKRDGQWHKIKIKVNPPRGLPPLTVRTKDGYYAVTKNAK
jgi:Ca-activated chloride channel family protein